MTDQMRPSRLVQRLERSSGPILGMKDNPFNFGGGLKNGGVANKAMDLLRPIFSFDYMGAAEYEFGAVPKALDLMLQRAKSGDLAARSFDVPMSQVQSSWSHRDAERPSGSATVFILGASGHLDEIEMRLRQWAKKDGEGIRDYTDLPRMLWPLNDWDSRKIGGLELDNGFLFFSDRDAWSATASLFGLDVDAQVSA